jgi:hypothetical protein
VYSVTNNTSTLLYTGVIAVVVTDNVGTVVYSGSAATYSTVILTSRFPISLTVTPAVKYLPATMSNVNNASNLIIQLQPIMTPISYSLLASNSVYTGPLLVVITDQFNATIYSGNATSWSSTTPLPGFPLAITATPNATYL